MEETAAPREVAVGLIDCDVHPAPARAEALLEYMDEPWRSRSYTIPMMNGRAVLLPPEGGRRLDALPGDGAPAGSDPALMRRQLFEEAGVDFGILIPAATPRLGHPASAEHSAACAAAVNRWLAATWLEAGNSDGRFRGSISLPVGDPDAAVREIETWAGHPSFVQCTVPAYANFAYGHAFYFKIWEAAARHGLPVAIHVNGVNNDPMLSPVGHPAHFVEWHSVGYPLVYASHLLSLLCEGVFERLPDLRFVFVEGGFTWLLPLLWHLEKNLSRAGGDVPLRRTPTQCIRDQVRFASQPVEEPEDMRSLLALFDMLDAEHVLMFATDYPHWDYDDPVRALPRLPEGARRRIFSENARELYGLPGKRPA